MTSEIDKVCYMRNPDVVLHEEDEDGSLVFNPDNDRIKVLNITGAYIWNLCDGTRDLEAIVSAVGRHFDAVPEGEVVNEVRGFLDDMIDGGFIGTVAV